MRPATDAPAGDGPLLTGRFVLVVGVALLYFLALGMLLPVLPLFVRDELHAGDVWVGLSVGAFAFGAVTAAAGYRAAFAAGAGLQLASLALPLGGFDPRTRARARVDEGARAGVRHP